jgi:Predicted transcriptional regulators
MAVFAPSDMKKWREAQGVSAADLAEIISCDTSTIHRYEAGKIKMNPDVMYEICNALGDVDKWCEWMRTEYPISYARVHPESVKHGLSGALMLMYSELDDLMDLQRATMRDGADGHIDDPALHASLVKEITEVLQCAQRVRNLLES